MIALGGSIGTGLLVGSGKALYMGGPAALLIAWGVVGTMVFCVVHALGELCVAFPVNGAFSTYATRFVDSSWGFAVGWNYAIMWLFVFPLELVAAAMCLQFWNTTINPVSWVAIFYVAIVLINLFGVKGYGEAEFYLTIFKIIALVGFIILGVILVCGGGPKHEFIGNKNWKVGAFANGFKGVATTFITASYSLAGTEMVGLAAAEVDNPRKVLPKAIRQVFWRVFLFYYLTLTFIGLLVPYNHPDLLGGSGNNASPFVIAIKDAGIKALPSIFNACILFAVVSVGNSSVFGCSRTIQSLGAQGLAPSWFAYIDRKGRPLVALGISAIFGALCFLTAYKDQGTVFNWLLSVAGLATVFAWFNIALCHFRFRRAMRTQKRSLDELVFTSVTGIWGSLYSMAFLILVLIAQFWVALFPLHSNGKPSAESFFQNYLGAFVILICYIGHKLYTRNWRIYLSSADIDLESGRRIVDVEVLQAEMTEEKEANRLKPVYIRLWNYWC
ncbi:general amino acid permease [Spathaspora passalidarum NRRL Y-27907]|uniref:General amino acid permease n=1 Tax=Spathaspora passalidarum (strain NRRL Y-27907 / 11-Y1) TaxID=619300 RepID=G3ANQ4_SPAPN|nr:general amino acid permease [Spathaspora passalidarum NRRL Y-27907]EGW31989.1 general amino acid permease [Spathaspora passalidarum NRRL Y-27907]